ncbi:alpha/beta hydrolase [Lysinibacillus sp. LZ02]|uniref:alpha/beta hydrolase n=1 Tax=Lysinibacillus sp. LZ02 TaxID=3420668 RepID=UPI003D35BB5B
MVAEELAIKGISSIRFDKRGVGDNAGLITSEEEVTFESFVEDVKQLVKYAKEDERFSSVHIIGHSEGALIGMLATQAGNVDSYISIAGAGRPIDELLLEQLQGSLSDDLLAESERILATLKEGEIVTDVPTELTAIFRSSVQPYMISLLKYHPVQVISELDVPILVVQGSADIQASEIDAQALKAGNEQAQLVMIKGMNHVLKIAPANRETNIATYNESERPLADTLIDTLVQFILQ